MEDEPTDPKTLRDVSFSPELEGLPTSNLGIRSVRGGLFMLMAQSIKFVLQTGSAIALARMLSPGDFGLVAMVTSLTGIATLLLDLGLASATVQRTKITNEQVNSLFWLNSAAGLVLAVLLAAASPFVASFYGEKRLVGIMLAVAAYTFVAGLGLQHAALLRRSMRFGILAMTDVASLLIAIAAAISLAGTGAGYWALVALPAVQAVMNTLFFWIAMRWRPRRPSWAPGTESMMRFGAEITGFNVLNYFARNADNVLVGWRWGAGPLGLYSRAYQFLLFPLQQINAPLGDVAIPALSAVKDDEVRYKTVYTRILESATLITLPAILLLLLSIDWLVPVILGQKWIGLVPIFRWLSVAAFLQAVTNTLGWLFISQGRSKEFFLLGVITSPVTVLLFILGLPLGPVGVAASYSIGYSLLIVPFAAWLATRKGPINLMTLGRSILVPVMLSASSGLILLAARFSLENSNPRTGIIILFLIFSAFMISAFLLVRPLRQRIVNIMNLLRNSSEVLDIAN